jgi:hypothetical protein
MTDSADHEWRARFEALRAADERDAPDFRAVVDRPAPAGVAHAAAPPRWRLRVALSIAAALLLSVGLVSVVRRRAFVAEPLSTWRSPTASLLRTTGSDLLRSSALMPSTLDQLGSVSLAYKEK